VSTDWCGFIFLTTPPRERLISRRPARPSWGFELGRRASEQGSRFCAPFIYLLWLRGKKCVFGIVHILAIDKAIHLIFTHGNAAHGTSIWLKKKKPHSKTEYGCRRFCLLGELYIALASAPKRLCGNQLTSDPVG
jgi:hypothetical protein